MAAADAARGAGAAGVERTTRHACAAPLRLGSIRAPGRASPAVRERVLFDPSRTRATRRVRRHR